MAKFDARTRQWRCGHGHILGYIERVRVVERGRELHETRLNVLRHAVDPDADDPAQVDVLAVIVGTTLDVTCDVCGCTKSWFIGEEAMARLLERSVSQRRGERGEEQGGKLVNS